MRILEKFIEMLRTLEDLLGWIGFIKGSEEAISSHPKEGCKTFSGRGPDLYIVQAKKV
jgi:hypothetical protein